MIRYGEIWYGMGWDEMRWDGGEVRSGLNVECCEMAQDHQDKRSNVVLLEVWISLKVRLCSMSNPKASSIIGWRVHLLNQVR